MPTDRSSKILGFAIFLGGFSFFFNQKYFEAKLFAAPRIVLKPVYSVLNTNRHPPYRQTKYTDLRNAKNSDSYVWNGIIKCIMGLGKQF